MRTEQRTVTTIIADEGKLLRRKSDQWVAGEKVTLGYNYYEGGVGLSEAKLETPEDYEEFDKPEDYEQPQIIDDVKRIQAGMKLLDDVTRRMEEEKKNINNYDIPESDALKIKDMYPMWKTDIDVKVNDKYRDTDGKLYVCDEAHRTQENWRPSVMSSLWHVASEGHKGTAEDPIPYNEEMNPFWQGMILEEGKYYTQNKEVYKCIRGTGNKVTHNLADLVSGGFVQKVE